MTIAPRDDEHPCFGSGIYRKPFMPLSHSNDFLFRQSPRDFIVDEIPLYEFSGAGEHLILKIRKKGITTWEMLDMISSRLGVPKRFIGYAGLKDKNALTTQYISLHRKDERGLEKIEGDGISILETHRHKNRLRIGHLKGNRFRIRLKKVGSVQRNMIESVIEWIGREGSPNYFGVQRFGTDGDNWRQGRAIVEGRVRLQDRKKREFLIGSYQSVLFNAWLSRRVTLSRLLESFSAAEVEKMQKLPPGALSGSSKQKQFFKIIKGDIMMHYPHGRIFYAEDELKESERFFEKDISPTGLLPGRRARSSTGAARLFEAECLDSAIKESGSRRYAWIFPDEIGGKYIEEKAHYELSFTLPKGSYATVVVDMLKGAGAERAD